MSGYGHAYRGYSTYNGQGPKTDDWSKTSSVSDHVCRPVIVDAEGRKQPIVSYSPNIETYVTKTEAIVEHVQLPFVTEYKHSSATKVEPWKRDFGVVEDKWRRPSSPVRVYGAVEDKWRRPSSPVRDYGAAEDKWRRPSSPVRVYGAVEDKWRRPSSPVHDRPQKVEDFITKVQTEASRPNKFGPLSATYWRQTPNSTGYPVGDYSEMSNNEWNKPSGNTIRNENYDDYYHKNDSGMEPNMITTGGWARPSRTTWSVPPNGSLSNPTSDIGTAIEMLKETANPSSGTTTSRYSVPVLPGPKRDANSEIVDSREAAKRYGNFSSRPVNTYTTTRPVNTYTTTRPVDTTPTIDSREAMKKYGGTRV